MHSSPNFWNARSKSGVQGRLAPAGVWVVPDQNSFSDHCILAAYGCKQKIRKGWGNLPHVCLTRVPSGDEWASNASSKSFGGNSDVSS